MIIYFQDQHNNDLNNWIGQTILYTDLLEGMELHKGLCMVAFIYKHRRMKEPIVLPFYFNSASDAENFFKDILSAFDRYETHLDLTSYKITVPEQLYKMVRCTDVIKDETLTSKIFREFYR